MEIKYEGILEDGTLYSIELRFKDQKTYDAIAEASKTQHGENVVKGGLMLIIEDMKDIAKHPDLACKLLSVNLANMQKKTRK